MFRHLLFLIVILKINPIISQKIIYPKLVARDSVHIVVHDFKNDTIVFSKPFPYDASLIFDKLKIIDKNHIFIEIGHEEIILDLEENKYREFGKNRIIMNKDVWILVDSTGFTINYRQKQHQISKSDLAKLPILGFNILWTACSNEAVYICIEVNQKDSTKLNIYKFENDEFSFINDITKYQFKTRHKCVIQLKNGFDMYEVKYYDKYYNAKISPNGKKIAHLALTENREQILAIYNLEASGEPIFIGDVSDFYWKNDHQIILLNEDFRKNKFDLLNIETLKRELLFKCSDVKVFTRFLGLKYIPDDFFVYYDNKIIFLFVNRIFENWPTAKLISYDLDNNQYKVLKIFKSKTYKEHYPSMKWDCFSK